jgi:hypothetical protein
MRPVAAEAPTPLLQTAPENRAQEGRDDDGWQGKTLRGGSTRRELPRLKREKTGPGALCAPP